MKEKRQPPSTPPLFLPRWGVKVLVIDGDLRRPRCHKMLKNVEKGPGLADILTGQREPQEVIQQTMVENLSLLSSGAPAPQPRRAD